MEHGKLIINTGIFDTDNDDDGGGSDGGQLTDNRINKTLRQ